MEDTMSEIILIVIRSLLSFIVVFTMARILGKKQISQLTFFDYVVGICIGDMASSIAIDTSVQLLNGVIGLIIYTILSLIIAFGAIKSLKIRTLVESNPTIIIRDGKVLEKNLYKNRMTFDDLMMGLRDKGAFKLSEVELAVLETNGEVSVMKKAEFNPITPSDINLQVEEEHIQSLIIIDGTILGKRLTYLGYTKEWLLGEIQKQGAQDFSDVFLAQIDSSGKVYVDLYNDEDEGKNQQAEQKPILAAKLRKIQADLESIALQSNDKNAKRMYYNQSQEISDLIRKINPYLKK
jgi:uncharacterized membrane protein YcaP (DUF421 family)